MLDLLGSKGIALGSVLLYGASNIGVGTGTDPLISNTSSLSVGQSQIVFMDNKDLYDKTPEEQYELGLAMVTSDAIDDTDFQKGLELIGSSADSGYQKAQAVQISLLKQGFASKADDTSNLIKNEVGRDLEEAADHLNDFVVEAPVVVAKRVQSFWKYGFKSIIYDDPEVKPYEDKMAYSLGRSVNSIGQAMAKHMHIAAKAASTASH